MLHRIIALLFATAWPLAIQAQQPPAPVATDTVVITTTVGDITVELYGNDAPSTVKNMLGLVEENFFDGILFHRVIPGFAVQTGDPNTKDSTLIERWGRGGHSIYGGVFGDELGPNTPSFKRGYVRGTLAMANRNEPNTNQSQFFIMLVDNDSLPRPIPPRFTIFGFVIDGWDTLEKIAAGKIADPKTGRPAFPVAILTVAVKEEE
jgi:cyclophilin family peptidyl-prolyl cis-trans isomerase